MGILPQTYQNKTDLDFCANRNKMVLKRRKYNLKKEKFRDFPGSKWPETIVRSF